MTVQQLLRDKRDEIVKLAARHGASNVRVFGSAARGEERPDSDIDLLVTLNPGTSLLDHIALIQDLEDLLGRKVDVVSDRAVHWYIRDRIMAEAQPL
jgi:predicted nucleotidyltransferase